MRSTIFCFNFGFSFYHSFPNKIDYCSSFTTVLFLSFSSNVSNNFAVHKRTVNGMTAEALTVQKELLKALTKSCGLPTDRL